MTSSEYISLANDIYTKALSGKRVLLAGDSFFISVLEKQLISKLADSHIADVSLATYKPALNAHFFSGGQLLIIDFFGGVRGAHALQFVDDLDEILILETKPNSTEHYVSEYILPFSIAFDKVSFIKMED